MMPFDDVPFFRISRTAPVLLTDFEAVLSAQVPAKFFNDVQSILIVGLECLYRPGGPFTDLPRRDLSDPAQKISEIVDEIVRRLVDESAGTLAPIPTAYAARLLACELLDFLDKAVAVAITEDLLERTANHVTARVAMVFGIDPIRYAHRLTMSLH